jgi:hypothetical protein
MVEESVDEPDDDELSVAPAVPWVAPPQAVTMTSER